MEPSLNYKLRKLMVSQLSSFTISLADLTHNIVKEDHFALSLLIFWAFLQQSMVQIDQLLLVPLKVVHLL